MPDVSVYITLCDMLGISINEFFAGEDIREENYIQKSEDNLIRIAKDSKYKIKKSKTINNRTSTHCIDYIIFTWDDSCSKM